MMEIVIFNLVCFGVEFLKITLLLLFFYGKDFAPLKKYITVTTVAFITVGLISCYIDLNNVLFGYTMILLVSFAIIQSNKSSIPFVFIMYMYICIIDMSINGMLMYIFELSVEQIENDKFLYTVLNMPSLIIAIPITVFRLTKQDVVSTEFINGQKLLLIIGGAAITLYTTSIQLFAFSDMGKKHLRTTAVTLSIVSVIFIIILMDLNKSRIDNYNLKKENSLVNRMLCNQEKYYLMLLEKENNTKAFRHDMKYHLICMNKLYKENKTEEFERYLQEFTEAFEELKINYDTGSGLINAIISDLSSKFSDVNLKCSGHYYDNTTISSFDICTILYNILNNAYEAAEKTEEKQIELTIGYLGTNLIIKLSNSALTKPVMKGKQYISNKTEGGHGYGLRNVCACIERLGGEFRMKYSEGTVKVEIVFFNVLPLDDQAKERYRLNLKTDQSP